MSAPFKTAAEKERSNIMQVLDFVSVIILAFAAVMFMAGVFTAYFGNGKSRTAGFLMLIAGIAVGVLWVFLCHGFGTEPIISGVDIWNVFWSAFVDLIGVLIGAIVAVAIFLIAVLKS